jgi:hypothetical protein
MAVIRDVFLSVASIFAGDNAVVEEQTFVDDGVPVEYVSDEEWDSEEDFSDEEFEIMIDL